MLITTMAKSGLAIIIIIIRYLNPHYVIGVQECECIFNHRKFKVKDLNFSSKSENNIDIEIISCEFK